MSSQAPMRAAGTVVLFVLAIACGENPPDGLEATSQADSPALDLSRLEIVDLSHVYDGNTLYWPTSTERFDLQELAYGDTEGGYFYSSYALATPEHGGTHLDAPIHFAKHGSTVEQIDLSRLIAPAVVVDVSPQADADRDYELNLSDLETWEAEHGAVPAGSIFLLRTGWSRHWPDALSYLGDDTPGDAGNLHFPGYGPEAARFLIEDRRVAALGVDSASLDPGPSTEFPVHQIAGAADVPGLENVTNLDRLPAVGSWLIALPIKTKGSGGPARIVALIPKG